jgi:hypothetical protein
MNNEKSKIMQVLLYGILLFAFIISIPTMSNAYMISGNGLYGHYTGTFSYNAATETTATVTVKLNNISPQINGGYLTGFVFNNPSNYISGVSLSSSNTSFELLGEAPAPKGKKDNGVSFQNTISAAPYGNFDIGAALGGDFLGGGSPNNGIPVGGTATFTFNLIGTNLSTLNENSFFSEYSSNNIASLTRFKGFANGQSDKVPGFFVPSVDISVPVPLPPTILLFVPGLIGLGFMRRKS